MLIDNPLISRSASPTRYTTARLAYPDSQVYTTLGSYLANAISIIALLRVGLCSRRAFELTIPASTRASLNVSPITDHHHASLSEHVSR